MKNVELPSELTQYNFWEQRFPPGMKNHVIGYLQGVRDILIKNFDDFPLLREVIVLPYGRGWKYKTAERGSRFIVYGTFRSEYRAILTTAKILASWYSTTLFQPIVIPLPQWKWRRYMSQDKALRREIMVEGILLVTRSNKG